jgi:PTS system glucose-specific IIC component
VPFFFQIGDYVNAQGQHIHGDIARFFASDPTAGILSGAFLFKVWGLPAAAIAMWHCARPDQRARRRPDDLGGADVFRHRHH